MNGEEERAMADGLENHILIDIAAWCDRHKITLSDAALSDAVRQIAQVHDQAQARATVLAAQVGAWEAQCAAQVQAGRALLGHIEAKHPINLVAAPELSRLIDILGRTIDTDAGRLMLEKHQQLQARLDGLNLAATEYSESRDRWYLAAQQAQAQAALYRGTISSAAILLRSRPIKTAFDDDVIRALDHTLAERDAGAAVLAELEAGRAVVEVARRILGKYLDVSALWSVLRDYDAVKVRPEP